MSFSGKSPVKIVLGTANVGDKSRDQLVRWETPEEINMYFNTFAKRGHDQIDTARGYASYAPGSAEPAIAAADVSPRFRIDTKVSSKKPGCHAKANILKEIDDSLEALEIKQANTAYLHSPDRTTKFEEAAEAMNHAYQEGKIKQWGICSYRADEVQQFVDICERNGWIKPSVYQGQYNLIVRIGEKELFPVLRKHGISFYAFSPAAGFFAGTHKKAEAGGRYDNSHMLGRIYVNGYMKPSIEAATDKALKVAAKHGIRGHAAALRWIAHHSAMGGKYGDAIVIAASSVGQLESNLDMLEQGPLPDDVVAAMGTVYVEVEEADRMPYHF